MPTYTGISDLPLVAGHPALDLVNTVEPRLPVVTADDQVHEQLESAADLLIWAQRVGLVSEAEATAEEQVWVERPGRARRSLAAVRAGREALYAILVAAESDSELELVSGQWLSVAARTRLRASGGGPARFERVVGTVPGMVVLDRTVFAVNELLTAVDLTSLRACPLEEGGCGWLFLDRSRGRTRRWCVMADCGARAKSRRLTDRRRAARAS